MPVLPRRNTRQGDNSMDLVDAEMPIKADLEEVTSLDEADTHRGEIGEEARVVAARHSRCRTRHSVREGFEPSAVAHCSLAAQWVLARSTGAGRSHSTLTAPRWMHFVRTASSLRASSSGGTDRW